MLEIIPIKRRTEMLPVRELGGREVFTYSDLAEGLQVDPSVIRKQFSRNKDAWLEGEAGVCRFVTASGTQEARWFSARGAMRFCRHVKSGRSDQLFDHLLDLWEAERAGRLAALPPNTEQVIALLTSPAGVMASRVITLDSNRKCWLWRSVSASSIRRTLFAGRSCF